jgi:prevent-host-death family protein
MIWKLADVKNKFSQVIDMALEEGPQRITCRGNTVIVVALKEFERLIGKKPGFKDYLRKAPSLAGLNFERDRSHLREASL